MNKISEKIKNFLEDVLLSLKNHFTSSKYIVKGKCKMCGECCKNILFSDENGYIKNENSFFKMQKKNKAYKTFEINGKIKDENDSANGALTFKCKHLKNNKCSIYLIRPLFCRDYPMIIPDFIYHGGSTLNSCGFYFAPNKKFKEYLK